jgi:2,4-dienoyl-CoA reductase-like NADH-dependent reductase (Old Yellow Enzyme family)
MDDAATATRTQASRETDTGPLFQPYRLGPFNLPHRVVMAPLTRSRARQPGNVPGSLAACYYAQRASAALIVSEATQVSMQGQGYAWTPGIHRREQVEAWRRITDAVHQTAGLMFCQLWHVGRISHPALQPGCPSLPRPSSPFRGAPVDECQCDRRKPNENAVAIALGVVSAAEGSPDEYRKLHRTCARLYPIRAIAGSA